MANILGLSLLLGHYLLAESCRSKGYRVGILDCCAENLGYKQASKRIEEINAKVTLFVVYGQNPNAGTTSMIGATGLAKCVYDSGVEIQRSDLLVPMYQLSLNQF